MNYMIDSDSGEHPFSPYYKAKRLSEDEEPDLILCSICDEYIKDYETIDLKENGCACVFCIKEDELNASFILNELIKQTGGDLTHEESYWIRNKVRLDNAYYLLADFDSAKNWFTNFNEELYSQIKYKKAKQ